MDLVSAFYFPHKTQLLPKELRLASSVPSAFHEARHTEGPQYVRQLREPCYETHHTETEPVVYSNDCEVELKRIYEGIL